MLVPEVASDEALPLKAEPEDAGIQPLAPKLLEPIAAIPPPSNGELADIPGPPGIPEGEAPGLQLGDIAGLRPPGSIMPSGEAARIPKVLVELCGKAVPQLNNSVAISVGNSRITDLPSSSFRPALEGTSSE